MIQDNILEFFNVMNQIIEDLELTNPVFNIEDNEIRIYFSQGNHPINTFYAPYLTHKLQKGKHFYILQYDQALINYTQSKKAINKFSL